MHQAGTAADSAFRRACQEDNMPVMLELVRHGCDLESSTYDGCTPLWLATEAGHAEVVEFLCSRGVDTGAIKDRGHATPLFLAAQNDHLAVARVLLHYGADPNSRSDTGATPLFIAAQHGYLEMVQLLLDSGARATITSHRGVSPIMMAAYQGHVNCVLLLLEAGCDTHEVALGRNVFEWAEAGGFGKEMAEAIVQPAAFPGTIETDENMIPWRTPGANSKSNPVREQHRDTRSYWSISGAVSETPGKTHGSRPASLYSSMGGCYEPLFLLRRQQRPRSASTTAKNIIRQPERNESVRSWGLRSSSRAVKTSSAPSSSRLQTMIRREVEENAIFEKIQQSRFQTRGFGKVVNGMLEAVNVQETHERWEIWKQMVRERLRDC